MSPSNLSKLLLQAAGEGNLRRCSILLRAGADIDYRDDLGNTPLMKSALGGHLMVVTFLLKKGANTKVKNVLDACYLDLLSWYLKERIAGYIFNPMDNVPSLRYKKKIYYMIRKFRIELIF